jgi:hypothetical protein
LLNKLGDGWIVEHNVPFAIGYGNAEVDIDHVAVGPYGVLVIESKVWTHDLDLSRPALPKAALSAVNQVKRNVGRLRAALGPSLADVPLIPVVVFWGRGVVGPEKPVRREDEVRIVAGEDSRSWAPLLVKERVSSEQRLAVIERVRAVADRQRSTGDAQRLTIRERVAVRLVG